MAWVRLALTAPHSGHNLTIDALGVLLEDIEEGAYVNLQVKYGLIKLINTQADLCEQMKQVDLKCPLKKGETNITKIVELPKEIPPVHYLATLLLGLISSELTLILFKGTYHVTADLYTKDDDPITCLTAQVHFSVNF